MNKTRDDATAEVVRFLGLGARTRAGSFGCGYHRKAGAVERMARPHPWIQESCARSYARISSGLKNKEVSRFALSTESLPCTTFREIVSPKSARIVPGSACAGSVAPIVFRTTATAFSPSHNIATDGPEVTYSTSPGKNALPLCSA